MVTFQPTRRGTPANTSPQEQAIREVVDAWGRARWGTDVRVLHELALGERRIDMVFVLPADLIGVEVKGPQDSIGADRVLPQLHEFGRYLPEVWLVVAEKWEHHAIFRKHLPCNKAIAVDGRIEERPPRDRRQATRDDLCCSRLLELLWTSETMRVARRATVPYEYALGKALPTRQVKASLARMLTGHEIVKAVCTELRARPLTGMASDEPLNSVAAGASAP